MNALLALMVAASVAFAADDGPDQVTMSLEEFLKLYEASVDREKEPKPTPPREFALSAATYDGEVLLDGDKPTSALFVARFRVENLRDPGFWVRVPVLPGSVAVRAARMGGAPAPLVLEGGQYTLVTNRQGAFDLDVEFAAAVTQREGSSGFEFPLMGSGATDLILSVPESDALDFTIRNAKLKTDRRLGSRRVVEATLPASGSLSVFWQREVPETTEQEPRIYSEVHTLVGVGDGVLTARATLAHTILFSGVDTLRTRIPDNMTVLDVRGAGLRDWTLQEDGTLEAVLNFAAEGSYSLAIDLERVVQDTSSIAVPLVVPVGAERSKGFVGVQPLSNLEITAGEVVGAAPIDVRTLPASILGVTGQPVLLGFKYLSDGAVIPLSTVEHEEVDVLVTLLDEAVADTMFTQDGRRLTSVNYRVRNNRRQFLRLKLPEQATLWSASVGGRPVQPATGGEGELLVPLVRSVAAAGTLAAFDVRVVYVESGQPPSGRGRGWFDASLPVADAPTTYVGWTVRAPRSAKIRKRRGDGSLRRVKTLHRPPSSKVAEPQAQKKERAQGFSGAQLAGGNLGISASALAEGATPVTVSIPAGGQPIHFEKLLALSEPLWVRFRYRGLK